LNRRGNLLNPLDTANTSGEMLVATDSSVQDGELCYVRSEVANGPVFAYRVNSGLVPDNVNIFRALYGPGVWQRTNVLPGGPSLAPLTVLQQKGRATSLGSTNLLVSPPNATYVVYGYLSSAESGVTTLVMSLTWQDPVDGLFKSLATFVDSSSKGSASAVAVIQTASTGNVTFAISAAGIVLGYDYYIGIRALT
jgi:hypothetical protein